MGAAAERAEILHRLAETLTVALANCGPLADEIEILKGGSAALVILGDIQLAVGRAVDLFPELRRVI